MLTLGGSIVATVVLSALLIAGATRIELSSRAQGRDKWGAGFRAAQARTEQSEKRVEQIRRRPQPLPDVASVAKPTPVVTTSNP